MKLKLLLSIIAITLILSLVIAQTSMNPTTTKIKLDKDTIDKLKTLNINKLSVSQYECPKGLCFKFSGDLNDTLITLNETICDGFIKQRKLVNMTSIINGHLVRHQSYQMVNTNRCRYRKLTDNEIYDYLDRATLDKINKLVKEKENNKAIKYGDREILK
jgi:hypothetical protein